MMSDNKEIEEELREEKVQSEEKMEGLGSFENQQENIFSFKNRSSHGSSENQEHEDQTFNQFHQPVKTVAHQPLHRSQSIQSKPLNQQPASKEKKPSSPPLQQSYLAINQSLTPTKTNGLSKVQKHQVDKVIEETDGKEEQKKYAKELEDEMEEMKKNFGQNKKSNKFFTAQKEKQSHKNRLNKTMAPPKTGFDEDSPEVKAMEQSMLTKMSQQKKKQNYHLLKEWDKKRAESLALHRNMIQILQSEVDKRIKSSIENLEIYITFFKEKARQQQRYASQPIINTRYALQNNSLSKNVYINCSVILNALSDENMERCKRINDLVQLLKHDILRDLIESHLSQSQRELLRVREKISTLKSSLRKHNTETEEKTKELAIFFNENSVNFTVSSEKDFYQTQLQFLRKADQQMVVQKKLGEYVLEYYHTAMSEEIKRSKVIRDAMMIYSRGLKQSYSIDIDSAEVQQLSKAEQHKLIQEFYSLEEIFDQRHLNLFYTYQKIPKHKELTVDIFSHFINKFQFQGFDSRIILLKQFHVKEVTIGKTTVKDQSSEIVITVDNFIHIFINRRKQDPYIKPEVTFRIGQKNVEFRQVKNQYLEIVMKEQRKSSMISYFWESKNDKIYRVQFYKKDSREEFLDYVNKLIG